MPTCLLVSDAQRDSIRSRKGDSMKISCNAKDHSFSWEGVPQKKNGGALGAAVPESQGDCSLWREAFA